MNVPNTIVATIRLAEKFVRYAKGTKDVRVDRLDLLSEVSSIKTLLEVARADFDYTSNIACDEEILNQLVKFCIKNPLNACYGALEFAVNKLEKLMPGGPDTKKPAKKRLRWPFGEWEMKALLKDTGRLKLLLLLRLRPSLVDFIDAARDELTNPGDVELIKDGVFSLEAGRRAHMKKIKEGLELGSSAWLPAPDVDQKRAIAFEKSGASISGGEWFLPKHAR